MWWSEGVSVERLRQISGKDYEEVTKNVLFSEVHSFTEQETMVDKAIKLAEGNPDFGLIIIDSMTMYYRLTSKEEERGERRSIAGMSARLLTLARKRGLPVLITSQVYTDIDKGTFGSAGRQRPDAQLQDYHQVGTGRHRASPGDHHEAPEPSRRPFWRVRAGGLGHYLLMFHT